MAVTDIFIPEARRAFGYLEREYAFNVEVTDSHWSAGRLLYRNPTTAVHLELDPRGPVFNVLVGPLEDGELPTTSGGMEAGEAVGWFPLWLVIRSDRAWPPAFSFSVRRTVMREELEGWAAALRTHAGQALAGEFSELRDAAALLRAQAELRAAQVAASKQSRAAAGSRRALGRAS